MLTIKTILLFTMINSVEIPHTWTPDFVITLSHSGSMSGASTEVKYTYEECTYRYSAPSGKPISYRFDMTAAMRDEILAKMRALEVDKVKAERAMFVVDDGWSNLLCFGTSCIEGGTSSEMTEEHKSTFLAAFGYLQQFAIDRKPARRR